MSQRVTRIKRITVDLPMSLYRRFARSPFRRECNTDGEAIRKAMAQSIGGDGGAQVSKTRKRG